MPKVLVIPSGARVAVGKESREIPFTETIEMWAHDARFGESLEGVQRSFRIVSAMRDAKEGKRVVLNDDDWTELCEAVRKPRAGYNVAVMVQCMAHVRAVLDAKDYDDSFPQAGAS